MAVAAFAVSIAAGAAQAGTTVVDFDSLPDAAVVADGYGGIIWGSNWQVMGVAQNPYNPASPPNRVHVNYALHRIGLVEDVAFSFAAPVVFDGAFFSGVSGGFLPGVSLKLYKNGALIATSGTLNQTSTSMFLASGYAGVVDGVRVTGRNGYYVMDDVTYSNAVPEPAAWALMICGFGIVGALLRRRRYAVAA